MQRALPLRPTRIHVEKNGEVIIDWNDTLQSRYSALGLRDACPCAHCRDEHTGRKILRREDIREDIYPDTIDLVGNYALSIGWNDGHHEGIFPWELLRGLCPKCPERLSERYRRSLERSEA